MLKKALPLQVATLGGGLTRRTPLSSNAESSIISRCVLAPSGGTAVSTSYRINGILGQQIAGVSSSGNSRIYSGFRVGHGSPALLYVNVWPGDMNNSGLVDEYDILPLADYWYYYGSPRNDNSYSWQAHPVLSWGTSATTYADADGSGRIDIGDFFAICLNWGKTHGDTISIAPIVEFPYLGKNREVLNLIYDQVKESQTGPKYQIKNFLEKLLGISSPTNFALQQNFPNPFNPSTTIRYELPCQTHIKLAIYNLLGQQVRILVEGDQDAGIYEVDWDGNDGNGNSVSSGLYFYKLESRHYSVGKRMLLIK